MPNDSRCHWHVLRLPGIQGPCCCRVLSFLLLCAPGDLTKSDNGKQANMDLSLSCNRTSLGEKTERTKLWPRRHLSLLVLHICVMMRHRRAGVSRGRVRRLSTPPKPRRSILDHKKTRYLWEKNHRKDLHCLFRGRRQVKPLRWIIEMKVH